MKSLGLYCTAGAILIAMFVLAGCGGGSSPTPAATLTSAAQTPITVTIADGPNERVTSFDVTIAALTLTNNTGQIVTVLSAPVQVELTHLVGTNQPIATANIPQGTYTQADLVISAANLNWLDGSAVQRTKSFTTSMPVSVKFDTPLTAGATGLSLNFEMSLATSVAIDIVNNTVTLNPNFLFTSKSVGEGGEKPESGKIEDVTGVITELNSSRSSFTMKTQMGTSSLACVVNGSTKYEGVSGYAGLQKGMLAGISGTTQTDGTVLCTEVEVKAGTPQLSFDARGIVAKTTGTPVTQLSLGVQEATISGVAMPVGIAPGRVVAADINNSAFSIQSGDISLSGLPFVPAFDASSIFPGQIVEIQTDALPTLASTPNVTAKRVVLNPGAYTGIVSGYQTNSYGAQFTLTFTSDNSFRLMSGIPSLTVYVPAGTDTGTIDLSKAANAVVRVRGLAVKTGESSYAVIASRIVPPEK